MGNCRYIILPSTTKRFRPTPPLKLDLTRAGGLADAPGTDGLLPRRELHLAASSLSVCDPCRPRRALARASAPAAERRAVHHSRLEPPASRTHTGLLLTRLSLALDSATWLPDLPRTIVARFVLRGLALQEPNATQAEAARHGDVLFVRARSVMLRENGPLQVHRMHMVGLHTHCILHIHSVSTAYAYALQSLVLWFECARRRFASARFIGKVCHCPSPDLAAKSSTRLPTRYPPRCHPGATPVCWPG